MAKTGDLELRHHRIFGCLSVCILIIYGLQFPAYFKRRWFHAYLIVLSLFYFGVAFLLPNELPRHSPTSFILWPFALVTIALDAIVLRVLVRLRGA